MTLGPNTSKFSSRQIIPISYETRTIVPNLTGFQQCKFRRLRSRSVKTPNRAPVGVEIRRRLTILISVVVQRMAKSVNIVFNTC